MAQASIPPWAVQIVMFAISIMAAVIGVLLLRVLNKVECTLKDVCDTLVKHEVRLVRLEDRVFIHYSNNAQTDRSV